MHPSEEMALVRLTTIAQMAATIYAGERIASETHNASPKNGYDDYDRGPNYDSAAKDAIRLYEAVEKLEYPDVATDSLTRMEG